MTAKPNLEIYFLMCWDYDNEEDECDKDQPGQEDDEGVEVEVGFALRLGLVIRPDHGQHCHALDIIENNHIISECFQLSCMFGGNQPWIERRPI